MPTNKDVNMKNILLLTFFLFSTPLFAGLEKCGKYRFNGVVRDTQDGTKLIINEKTLSEYKITFDQNDSLKLTVYHDQHVSGELDISKLSESYVINKDVELLSVNNRVPNPLNSMDTFLKIETEKKCEE